MQLCALQVRFGGRQLCSLLVGGWWKADMCPSGEGLVVGSFVPFRLGFTGRQICAVVVGGWW
jgi:hypothetical protein